MGEIYLSPRTLRVAPFKFGSGADPWTLDPSVFPDNKSEGYCHSFTLRARRVGGAVRNALGPNSAPEINEAVNIEESLSVSSRHVALARSSEKSAKVSDILDVRDLLDVMESNGGRLPSKLLSKLGSQLATIIPLPPGNAPPWGRAAFETLLNRFVAYWSKYRDVWIEDLGDNFATYELLVYAFFARQSGQLVQHLFQRVNDFVVGICALFQRMSLLSKSLGEIGHWRNSRTPHAVSFSLIKMVRSEPFFGFNQVALLKSIGWNFNTPFHLIHSELQLRDVRNNYGAEFYSKSSTPVTLVTLLGVINIFRLALRPSAAI
jgi:hypothetical protein